MNQESLEKAKEIQEEINRLEDWMFWCSGKINSYGTRKYPASLIKLKRKWYGAIEGEEYELPTRLQEKITLCVEEELELLKQKLEEI